MKLNMWVQTEVVAAAIRLTLPVDYGDEDMPLDYPHRKDDVWTVTVDLDTGQIRDWPTGVPAHHLYMKVCDSGTYCLLDGNDQPVGRVLEQEYVPDCIPGECGDYVDFRIDEAGRITNWKLVPDEVGGCFDEKLPGW